MEKFTNQMTHKITNNLENFSYNVIIANIYETYNFLSKQIKKKINNKSLKENYIKILTLLTPAIPHFASECIEDLNVLNKLEWPETNSKFLNEDKIDYVVQINGKKRLILNENRDMDKESLLDKIKANKMSEKYLKDKKIHRVIFIKNRLINLLLDE